MSLSADPKLPGKVVLAYLNEPPFCWRNGAGEVVGLDIEVAFTVLRALRVETIETRFAAFADFIPGVAAGDWTINVPMFVTPERATLVAFSRPVWSLSDGLMLRADDPRRFTSYEAVGHDETAVVGVIAGQIQREVALRAGMPAARLKVFPAPGEAIEALLAGSIDAYASAAMVHRGLLAERRDERLRIGGFRCLDRGACARCLFLRAVLGETARGIRRKTDQLSRIAGTS